MSLAPLHRTILVAQKYSEKMIIHPIAIKIEVMCAKIVHIHIQAEWVKLLEKVYFHHRIQTHQEKYSANISVLLRKH